MEKRTFSASAADGVEISSGLAVSQLPPITIPQMPAMSLGSIIGRILRHFLFKPAYVKNVILPFLTMIINRGERLSLPMIDVTASKENAVPPHLFGIFSEAWRLKPEDGLTVFLQTLEKRGPHNRRKKIYMSAVTLDLYRPMYSAKVMQLFDKMLDDKNAGKPLMRLYLDGYFDLYWDLHLGVKGDAIPARIRQFGESFNNVFAYMDPTQKITYDNYMTVRSNFSYLKGWVDERVTDIAEGRTANPQQTFVYYWLKNGEEGEHFRRKDVIFECFHNFVACSQWGSMINLILAKLCKKTGDADVRAWFKKTMESNFDHASDGAFTPLECFVMELFRTITPNPGSLSTLAELVPPPFERYNYVMVPHAATSFDPRHWKNPEEFDPMRYNSAPTSHQIDEAKFQEMGFARCPFERKPFELKDGRNAVMQNSGFGTVYGIVDGKPLPVCDYAGFAPFGFGYRRCPGEQITIQIIGDFLRKVWKSQIEFDILDIANPPVVPMGGAGMVCDNVGFSRGA